MLYCHIDEGRLKVKNINLKEKIERKNLGVSIGERLTYINNSEEVDHFEIDTVHWKKGESTCVLILTERKTREGIVVLIDFKESEFIT